MRSPLPLWALVPALMIVCAPLRGNDIGYLECLAQLEHLWVTGSPTPDDGDLFVLQWEVRHTDDEGYEVVRTFSKTKMKVTRPNSTGPAFPVWAPSLDDLTAIFRGDDSEDETGTQVTFGRDEQPTISFFPIDEGVSVLDDNDDEWGLFSGNITDEEDSEEADDEVEEDVEYVAGDRLVGTFQMKTDLDHDEVQVIFQSYLDPTYRQVFSFFPWQLEGDGLPEISVQFPEKPHEDLNKAIAGVTRGLREDFGDDYIVIPKGSDLHVEREIKDDWDTRDTPLWTGDLEGTDFKQMPIENNEGIAPQLKKLENVLRKHGTDEEERKLGHGKSRLWLASKDGKQFIVYDFHSPTTELSTNIAFEIRKKAK